MAQDPNGGLPIDPTVLQGMQQQQLFGDMTQGFGGNAATRANMGAAASALSSLFPSPQVQQARQTQAALRGAQVSQNPGESDVDYSIRQLQAQRDAVAPFDPQAAAQMNTQLLKLGQMKIEQSHLIAQDQREQAEFQEGEPGRQAAASQAKATGTLAYVVNQDPNSDFGFSAKAYDTSNPDDVEQLRAAARKGGQIMSASQAAQLFGKTDVASMRVQQALVKAQVDANSLTPEGINLLAGNYAIDPNAMARQPPSVRAQVLNRLANVGVTPTDMAAARSQLRFLNSDASTVGRRAGNIDILQNEMQGMGDQVLKTLGGVTRTSWTTLNSMIATGKGALSDPGEKAYAGAIQSFVNTYARVISGGTGQSTDSARSEAWALLNKADGPAAVKAAVNQLAVNELGIVRQASSTAVEALAHPEKYGAILKIQEKLGFKALDGDDSRFTATQGQATPQLPPSQTQGQGGLPAGWSVVQH
jgi:hypothetical protein